MSEGPQRFESASNDPVALVLATASTTLPGAGWVTFGRVYDIV
jgi:hypothetical protein